MYFKPLYSFIWPIHTVPYTPWVSLSDVVWRFCDVLLYCSRNVWLCAVTWSALLAWWRARVSERAIGYPWGKQISYYIDVIPVRSLNTEEWTINGKGNWFIGSLYGTHQKTEDLDCIKMMNFCSPLRQLTWLKIKFAIPMTSTRNVVTTLLRSF